MAIPMLSYNLEFHLEAVILAHYIVFKIKTLLSIY